MTSDQLVTGDGETDRRPPVDTAGLWNHESYEAILYGMDFLRDECRERFGEDLPQTAVHRRIVQRLQAAPHKLPTHEAWLKQTVGMPDYRAN